MKDISQGIQIVKSSNSYLGMTAKDNSYFFTFESESLSIKLLLFDKPKIQPDYEITVDSQFKEGDIFCFAIKNIDIEGYCYLFEDQNQRVIDPCSKRIQYLIQEDTSQNMPYGVLSHGVFHWENDQRIQIPTKDLIIYKAHVRGYTMSESSKVEHKGTFSGMIEKIPYLVDLGINGIELMPVYEFEPGYQGNNYWGYSKGLYFTPKVSYSSMDSNIEDYTLEMKEMVKQFHRNGIQVILEMYFEDQMQSGWVSECIRYWKNEYHIDGIHLICSDRIRREVAENPYLKNLELLYSYWPEQERIQHHHLIEYNENFSNIAKHLLRGDENQLQEFVHAIKNNPEYAKTINYITNHDGMTLNDLFMYDRKHNELNGENNRDGRDFNYSWNCGVEGPTRKVAVNEIRLNLIKIAMGMMMLSQGIPLIYAGDEFRNSQSGNNNAYCQDNEIGWTDWKALRKNQEVYKFVKSLIAFRKNHNILHMDHEPYMMDYKFKGYPDMSFHGSQAWYPELEHYNRHVGIMYYGSYAEEEQDVFIAYNLHWEDHRIALPTLLDKKWKVFVDTNDMRNENKIVDHYLFINSRSMAILVSEKNS